MNPCKTLCIDLDGTLCEIRSGNQLYSDVAPLPGAIQAVNSLKKDGWKIIIHTARQMHTYHGNIGQINKHTVPVIVEWLDRWGFQYDEVIVGKPLGIYIDDRAIRFENDWNNVIEQLQNI